MVWHDLIGNEFNDRELHNISQRFNTDNFYCKSKNLLEYEIGIKKDDKDQAVMTLSRDRVIVFSYNLQTYCSAPEVSLVAHKLELVRPTGLEHVLREVNHANKSRASQKPYVSN